MSNVTADLAALEQLPEADSAALGGHDSGCLLITCLVSCLSTVDVDDW